MRSRDLVCGCGRGFTLSAHLANHLPTCLGSRSPDLEDLYRIGRVKESGGCIEWGRKRNQLGYGILPGHAADLLGETRAHRAALALFLNRPIGEGLNVLHECDNPPCLNPVHLREGTQKDNMRDMMRRERNGGQFESHPSMIRECVYCGKSFEVRPWKTNVTCSRGCAARQSWVTAPDRNIRRSPIDIRVCPECGQEFQVTYPSSRKITCGETACVTQRRWRTRHERNR